MSNEKKLLVDIGKVYDEIYSMERERVEINKKIHVKKNRLNAMLNFIKNEYK